MHNIHFVPSALHVVASGVDISKDLETQKESSISTLLNDAYEKEKDREKTDQ
jgi:hypothetical protein